jgi:hypothetical protein
MTTQNVMLYYSAWSASAEEYRDHEPGWPAAPELTEWLGI